MQATDIRERLHQLIDVVDDRKAEALYTLLTNGTDIDTQRKKLVQAERDAYLKGEVTSYSWEEVKDMAMNKDRRDVLQP